jgi:exodeoxyribonuclease V alpha subunit
MTRRAAKPTKPLHEQTSITGTVERIYFSSPTFSAGVLRDDDTGATLKFSGKFAAAENDALVLTGEWTTHEKYGRQFTATLATRNTALSGAGLAAYLEKSPAFKGIGPVKSKIIALRYGAQFAEIIVADPARVARECKIPIPVAFALSAEWKKHHAVNALATQLAAYELTNHQIETLIAKYGDAAPVILRENPYQMLGDLYGFGFKRLDEIARKAGVSKTFVPRLRAGLSHVVIEQTDAGHTWVESDELVNLANALLILDTLDSRKIIEGVLDDMILDESLAVESHDGRFLVAVPLFRQQERDIADWLRRGYDENPHALRMMGVCNAIRSGAIEPTLNERQREALTEIVANKITFITGGAGSGKTYTIAAAVRVFEENGRSVIMCAPTGKAAKRMTELTDHDAQTIHRLLGWDAFKFQRGLDEHIPADVLIVDETSMVDISLAWNLLRRVNFARTSVVFVGDYNQLPPIGPGNLLRDAVETRLAPVVILTDVVRQAGELKRNSVDILAGRVAKTSAATLPDSPVKPWYVIDHLVDPAQVESALVELLSTILPIKLGLDVWRDVQILTPKRQGPLSVTDLNIALQRLYQQTKHGVITEAPAKNRRPAFLVGDKVIQRRNDYGRDVMNGTLGVVVEKDAAGNLTVAFDGVPEPVFLDKTTDALRNLDLAYALTIHQTQGSEFPFAVVIVHKSHSFMHHRNLLYTAVTRARKSVIVLGDRWGIENCARKRGSDLRNTWLALERPASKYEKIAKGGTASVSAALGL